MDIKQLSDRVQSQIATIALCDRERRQHREQIASLETKIKRLEAYNNDLLGRIIELEDDAQKDRTIKTRLAAAARRLAAKIEAL